MPQLPKCLRKHADKIAEVSDERQDGDVNDGYWVYLTPGWFYENGETHCIHEDTPAECAKEFDFVVPCTRECCRTS